MNRVRDHRQRPWGRIALALAVLAWGSLIGGVFVYLSSASAPGDGAHGIAAVHGWLLFAMGVLVASSAGSSLASLMAWRSGQGRASAAVAALLLALLVLVLGIPMLG